MNPQFQQKIVDRHGPLVSHSEDPAHASKPGAPSLENSGPPSPTSGPIINFGEIIPGLYRSSFPRFGNFEHLQSLGLKTILTLVGEVYPVENVTFMEKHGIQHHQIPIPAHKDPSVVIPPENTAHALRLMLDPSNYPMLVHCNKGKHRTGCITACFRKIHDEWATDLILAEYRKYAGSKWRALDEAFIGKIDVQEMRATMKVIECVAVQSGKQPALPTPPGSDGFQDWDSF